MAKLLKHSIRRAAEKDARRTGAIFFIARTLAGSFVPTPAPGFDRVCLERRPPFEDDVIHTTVNTSLSRPSPIPLRLRRLPADAVHATYAKEKPNV